MIHGQTTTTRNLKVLERRDLIAVEPSQDRWIKLISLIVAGQTMVAEALPSTVQEDPASRRSSSVTEVWQMLSGVGVSTFY